VTGDNSHVSVGGLLVPGRSGKKDDCGNKVCTRKVTAGGRTTHVHARKHAKGK
jgi:hypothetical protein